MHDHHHMYSIERKERTLVISFGFGIIYLGLLSSHHVHRSNINTNKNRSTSPSLSFKDNYNEKQNPNCMRAQYFSNVLRCEGSICP